MTSLGHRKNLIQQRRKNTSYADFIQHIASRYPITFHRNGSYVSRYPDTDRSPPIISHVEFQNHRDNNTQYGREYQPDQDFFEQFTQLRHTVPQSATIRQMPGPNTSYADTIVASSNCYLSSVIVNDCKDIYYSILVLDYCQNIFNSFRIQSHCHNIYQSIAITHSTNIFFSHLIENSSNIRSSSNLVGCHHCIDCHDLHNQSYCYQNQPVPKEQFDTIKKDHLTHLATNQLSTPPPSTTHRASQDCSGSYITNSNHVHHGHFINRLTNGRNVICVGGSNQEKDCYDAFDAGVNSHDLYGVAGVGTNASHVYCSSQVESSANIFYSFYLVNCSHCIGCIGLQNKHYCILNQPYDKDTRHKLADEIFGNMHKDDKLGEFFPTTLNPFYYNDTMASVFGDTNQKTAADSGYLWRDAPLQTQNKQTHTIPSSQLDRNNYDPDIIKHIYTDPDGQHYQIIPQERHFLRKHSLPLPSYHWLTRLKQLITRAREL